MARAKESRLGLRRAHPVAVAGGASRCVLLVAVVAVARPDGRLHVTVLDIGQGDSILLEGPNGGRMLIDTGPDPDLELKRLDERIPAWDRRIDLVVLSHPHEDHVGGLWLLLQRYRVGEIVESGMVGRGPGDAAYRRVLAEQGRQTTTVAAGDRLWLDGIELDVEWPLTGTVPAKASDDGKQVNNESVVIDLRYGSRTMVFTGDMEEEVDPQLLARGLADHLGGPIDVLKVAHHGSATATTDALLDVLQPRIAAVSVGTDNPYGHPAPSTLERLRDHGATVYRTDLDGSIEITTDGISLTVTTERHRVPEPTRTGDAGADRVPTYNRSDVRSIARRRRCPSPRPAAEREALAPFTAVAEVAAFLAAAMVRRGVALDMATVEAAALLHDLDKMLPADDPLKAMGHGAAGAEWLRQRGYDELAPAVAAHPVMELGYADSYDAWADRAGLIGRVVTYADKRARQDVLSLTDRFALARELSGQPEARPGGDPRPAARARDCAWPASSRSTCVARAGSRRRCVRGLSSPISGRGCVGNRSAGRDFRAGLEQQAGQVYDVWRTAATKTSASRARRGGRDGKRRDRVIDGSPNTSPPRRCSRLERSSLSAARLAPARGGRSRTPHQLLPDGSPGNALVSWTCSRPVAVAQPNRGTQDAIEAAGWHGQGLPCPVARAHGGLDHAPRGGAGHHCSSRRGAPCSPSAWRLRREGDVDRRRMSELANGELEKLALYRPNGIDRAPRCRRARGGGRAGSTWAFLDALGSRRTSRRRRSHAGCSMKNRDPGHDHADAPPHARADRRRRPPGRGHANRPISCAS